VSRLDAEHYHAHAACVGPMGSAPSKVQGGASWASVVSTPVGSAPPSDVVLQSTLGSLVEQLQGCLMRVGSFLERAEDALRKLSLEPAMLRITHYDVYLI
jgi:hypothetical protein